MRETTERGTWIPSQMKDNSVPPKIASFASNHDPSLLYAKLLRKYNSGLLTTGLTHHATGHQESRVSGYFCKHDGLVSFVVGADATKLKETLKSFKEKYEKTDWTLPNPLVSKEQQEALKQVATENLNNQNLIKTVCQKAAEFGLGIKQYKTKCPILYGGTLSAVPHAHVYSSTRSCIDSLAFQCLPSGIFISFTFEAEDLRNKNVLYRPHAYLVFKETIMPEIYEKRHS